MDGIGFNSPIWLELKLGTSGWKKITDASELQAGDIVLMNTRGDGNPDHVQIYAGDDKWYNAGATFYIQSPAPYVDGSWRHSSYWWAYRQPNSGKDKIYVKPGELLDAAQKVHDAQRKWNYGNDKLIYRDIEKSLYNPQKQTCCATYVSHVLYVAGYFTEDEMNQIGYNYQVELDTLLKKHGWKKITDESQLQAGDIVFLDIKGDEHSCNHVQIYAGDGKWYNAGNVADIQNTAPKQGGDNWKSGFDSWWAYRPPALNKK